MKISVLVGNPKPRSRTYAVATRLGEQIAQQQGVDDAVRVVDLADHAGEIFRFPSETLDGVVDIIASSDLLIVASPTYKATYTGLLKSFLDRLPGNRLAGVRAIPVMTAGAPQHALAMDFGLCPLLIELGASVPWRGLFCLVTDAFDERGVVDSWLREHYRGTS